MITTIVHILTMWSFHYCCGHYASRICFAVFQVSLLSITYPGLKPVRSVLCMCSISTVPPTVLSHLTSHPQPSPIIKGSSVELLCEATSGYLPISYSWTDPNGQTLSPGSTNGRISFTLYIYGNYTCTATNDFGVDSSTVEVIELGTNSVPQYWSCSSKKLRLRTLYPCVLYV